MRGHLLVTLAVQQDEAHRLVAAGRLAYAGARVVHDVADAAAGDSTTVLERAGDEIVIEPALVEMKRMMPLDDRRAPGGGGRRTEMIEAERAFQRELFRREAVQPDEVGLKIRPHKIVRDEDDLLRHRLNSLQIILHAVGHKEIIIVEQDDPILLHLRQTRRERGAALERFALAIGHPFPVLRLKFLHHLLRVGIAAVVHHDDLRGARRLREATGQRPFQLGGAVVSRDDNRDVGHSHWAKMLPAASGGQKQFVVYDAAALNFSNFWSAAPTT